MQDQQYKDLKEFLNFRFKTVDETLGDIKSELKKINGRVSKHDDQITEALTERAKNRADQHHYFECVDDLSERMVMTEKQESAHVINCPVNPDFRKIEKAVLTMVSLNSFKKGSRLYWVSILALIISSISVLVMFFKN